MSFSMKFLSYLKKCLFGYLDFFFKIKAYLVHNEFSYNDTTQVRGMLVATAGRLDGGLRRSTRSRRKTYILGPNFVPK